MNRNPIYDRAKGIGIVLVVYGHLFKYGSFPFSLIFSFHMPLFFIISGVLFTVPSWNDKGEKMNYYKKVLTKYTIPFVFFSMLGLIAKYFIDGTVNYRLVAKELLNYIGSDELMTGALWFIGLLAIAMLILPYMIYVDKGSYRRQFLIILGLAVISYLCGRFPIYLFLRGRSISAVIMYVYIGYLVKNHIAQWLNNPQIKRTLLFSFPLFLILVRYNQTVNIAVPVFNDFMIYVLCSLYGTLFVLKLSKWDKLSVVEYLGKNSLIIFCVHAIWIAAYVNLVNSFFGTNYKPMIDLPMSIILIGGLFVLGMSLLTTVIIGPLYIITNNTIRKRLKI